MIQSGWVLAPPVAAERLARFVGMHPVLAQALINRGYDDPAKASQFLHDTDLADDPFAMKDMDRALDRIERAITKREAIVVYGDFDADGVTATVLLTRCLASLGARVKPYIPDRATEGYGLNTPALQRLAAEGASLLISVDCGIRSVAEVAAGTRAGLDIIVTDHHSVGQDIPDALAVINPQQATCGGNPKLAGVGVAYMLATGLLSRRMRADRAQYPPDLRLSDMLDLVALGTVADVAALNDRQNRRLVSHGLAVINEMRRPGLRALCRVSRLQPGSITASDIAFVLGPRINAAGRLGSAMTAYRLLAAETLDEALPYAQELQIWNARRQQLTGRTLAAIGDSISETDAPALIFAADETFLAGIVGLVAGRLCERFYRPAVVLEIREGESRASCRSIPEFNITDALDECADLLLRHGGHAAAAGFTVANSNIDALRDRLGRLAQAALRDQALRPRLEIDMEVGADSISRELVAALECLEPTGHANPPVSLLCRAMPVLDCRRVGADGKHLKLKLAGDGRAALDAIGFGLGDWASAMPRIVDAVFNVEMNEWNGSRNLQLRLLDIRPAGRR